MKDHRDKDHRTMAYRDIVKLVVSGHRRIFINVLASINGYEFLNDILKSPHINNRLTFGVGRKMDVLILSPNRLISNTVEGEIIQTRSNVCFETPSRPDLHGPRFNHWDLIIVNQCKDFEAKQGLERYRQNGLISENTRIVNFQMGTTDHDRPVIVSPSEPLN